METASARPGEKRRCFSNRPARPLKKIAMMAYDTSLPHMQEREKGYKAALKANGIRFKKEWLREASFQSIERTCRAI